MDTVAPFLILLAIAALFWLAIIRPQQRRQQALGRLQKELSVGDEVMLTSGIIGVLRSLDEETVQIEVSEGVIFRVVRGAVGQVRTPAARDENTQVDTQPAAEAAAEPEEN